MENQFASCRAEAFPAGLRVLVVDDDPTWLKILEKMLRKCSYEVTTCGLARVALDILRERKDKFDIVISDVNMPDMDGFKLLEHVGLEMDLPVIMMSIDGETSRVMKGVQHGACDYLLKPVRMKELRNIWQHVYRKRMHEVKEIEGHNIHEDIYFLRNGPDDLEERRFFNGNDTGSMRKRKDVDTKEHADQDFNDPVTVKKARVVWSVDLHQKFVNAVNQIGFDKVGPKKILDLMNVPGLTRENVASHLQKYRLYLSRLQKQNEGRINGSMPPSDCGNKDRAGSFGIQNLKEMQQDNNVHASYLSAKFQAQEINVAGSHVDDLRDLSNSRITDNMKPLKESSYRSQKADELSQLDVIFSSKNMTPNVGNKLCDQTISEYKIRNEGRPATQFMKYPKRIHERCNLLEDFSCLPKPDQEQHFVSNQLQSTPSIIPITCNRENDTTGLLFELKPVLTDYTSGCISNISPMTWAIDPVAIQMKHDTVHCQEFGANSNSPSTKDERFEQSYDNGCPHSGHDPSVKTGIDLDLLPEDLHLFALQGIGCFKNGGMDGRDIFEDSATAPAAELIQGNWYEGSEFNCENSYDLLDYPTDEFLFAQ